MTKTVIHFIDSEAFGGAEQMVLQMLAGLDRRRWQPVLFHHSEPGISPLLVRAQSLNVKLRAVPRLQTVRDINRLPEFVRAIRSERPAIFHAHLTWPLSCKYGLGAATLAGIRAIVATAHTCQDFPRRQLLLRAQPRLIATVVDRYLAVSDAAARVLREFFKIPGRKVTVVHNGVPLGPFARRSAFATGEGLTLATKRPIVLTTGRLDKEKGHKHLLDAAALVPQATFALAGDGPERSNLETQAKGLGIDNRVIFLGHRDNIADLLGRCDVFALASLSEGLSVSLLEAMAASKPVIASNVGGNKEVVAHGVTGLMVPPADSTALANAIETILSDHSLAQRLAAAGRAQVERQFSARLMVSRVSEIYEELLGSPSRRTRFNFRRGAVPSGIDR